MPAAARLYPITATLIRRLLKWALLCILVFGTLRAGIEYTHAQTRFHQAVRSVADLQIPSLSVALWDIEPQAVQRQIDALRVSAPVAYAQVLVNTGQRFASGQRPEGEAPARMRLAIPAPGDARARIATLELVADMDAFHAELARDLGWMLAQCALFTALMLGLVVLILRRDLERPMRQLARFAAGLQTNALTQPLELARGVRHRYDEIDLVADGLRTLQSRIQLHISTLDAEVAERTLQLETALEALKTLSHTDALSGCYNRRLFNERFARELSRAGRYERPLSLIFCDIDHFKQVNDRHGHQVGDQVIAGLGACLRRLLRGDVDWVVRYGGEEFVIVLPETGMADAWKTAERIRLEVEQRLEISLEAGATLRVSVSVSMGVAQQCKEDVEDTLLRRADACLYAAKHAGRNRVWPPAADLLA